MLFYSYDIQVQFVEEKKIPDNTVTELNASAGCFRLLVFTLTTKMLRLWWGREYMGQRYQRMSKGMNNKAGK